MKSNEQIIFELKEKWKECFREAKEKWDQDPGWPAKLVSTTFVLNGVEYTIEPPDLGLSYDPWNQGFMESIQQTWRNAGPRMFTIRDFSIRRTP